MCITCLHVHNYYLSEIFCSASCVKTKQSPQSAYLFCQACVKHGSVTHFSQNVFCVCCSICSSDCRRECGICLWYGHWWQKSRKKADYAACRYFRQCGGKFRAKFTTLIVASVYKDDRKISSTGFARRSNHEHSILVFREETAKSIFSNL